MRDAVSFNFESSRALFLRMTSFLELMLRSKWFFRSSTERLLTFTGCDTSSPKKLLTNCDSRGFNPSSAASDRMALPVTVLYFSLISFSKSPLALPSIAVRRSKPLTVTELFSIREPNSRTAWFSATATASFKRS